MLDGALMISACPLLAEADMRPQRERRFCRVGPGNFTPSLVWGFSCQGVSARRRTSFISFFVRSESRSFVPTRASPRTLSSTLGSSFHVLPVLRSTSGIALAISRMRIWVYSLPNSCRWTWCAADSPLSRRRPRFPLFCPGSPFCLKRIPSRSGRKF
jgi:hypothetical protein